MLLKKRLSSRAAQKIETIDDFLISSITIWEIGIKIKKAKLSIPIPLEDFVAKLGEIDNFHILAIDETTWIQSLNLNWDHRDPADRIIVASSSARDMELITSDHAILEFYPKAVW